MAGENNFQNVSLLSDQDQKSIEILINDTDDSLPDELFLHCFTFLSQRDLNTLASVSHSWQKYSYNPYLWPSLDLSRFSHGVHNNFLRYILTSSSRFVELYTLNLEGCDAITDEILEFIAQKCPQLKELLLTNCFRLTTNGIARAIILLPSLEKIELYGVTSDFVIVDRVLGFRPKIDFGLFWFQYCAEKGCRLDLEMVVPESEFGLMELGMGPGAIEFDELKRCESTASDTFDGHQSSHQIASSSENSSIESLENNSSPGLSPPRLLIKSRDHTAEFPGAGIGLDDMDTKQAYTRHEHDADDHYIDYNQFLDDENNDSLVPRPVPATCRYEDSFVEGGCWGVIRGRIVYSNQAYHRGGNYPSEILYSCQSHTQLDFKEDEFTQCDVCNNLFRQDSCWTDLICKSCYDRKNLQNKRNWLQLKNKSIKEFNFADLAKKTLVIADERNLPTTLKKVDEFSFDLDMAYAVENGDLKDDDDVPMRLFWEGNQARIDDQMHHIKRSLKKAQKESSATRALFCYSGQEENSVKILADRGVVFDGIDGEEFLSLTGRAWGEFFNIITPIVVVLLTAMYFSSYAGDFDATGPRSTTIAIQEITERKQQTVFYMILTGALLAVIIILMVLFYRYRTQCEQVFKKFLVLDILMIIAFGTGALLILVFHRYAIDVGVITFSLALWNFGVVGLCTFYCPVPPALHRFYLVLLNCIMAILITITLGWYVIFFILLAVIGDVASMLRPNMNVFTPFILPPHIQLVYTTPKIFYEVNGMRLRASDFMFYGMMIGLATPSLLELFLSAVTVLASVVLSVFVLPFFSKNIRPLPVAFILLQLIFFVTPRAVNEVAFNEYRWNFVVA